MASAGRELELADLLLIGEAVLGIRAEELHRVARLPEAESALAAPHASFGGVEFYPDPAERAAILCSRIIRNHPFPDGNKRIAFLCMIEALHREGIDWVAGDQNAVADVIEALAAREITENQFIAWVAGRTVPRAGREAS
jgi:death-on-curing protein